MSVRDELFLRRVYSWLAESEHLEGERKDLIGHSSRPFLVESEMLRLGNMLAADSNDLLGIRHRVCLLFRSGISTERSFSLGSFTSVLDVHCDVFCVFG